MSLFQVGVFQNRILIHVFPKSLIFISYFLSDFTIICKSKHIRKCSKIWGFIELAKVDQK